MYEPCFSLRSTLFLSVVDEVVTAVVLLLSPDPVCQVAARIGYLAPHTESALNSQ